MRFAHDDDALLLQKTLRDFLAQECTPARLRALWDTATGRSPELWRALAELGVAGLLVPEAQEGLGRDETDLVLIFEEVGRAGLAESLVETAAVGAPLLRELGDAALCERWLKPVATGEARIAVGHPALPFVADAHVADLLLLPHGDALHALAPRDVSLVHEPASDPARRVFSVRFAADAATRVAEGERARTLLAAAFDRGALACAAQALGVADRLLEMSVGYARQREQFGKPIGSFQAVKHQLANVKLRLEYARPVVQRAAWSAARGLPRRALDVSHAKLAACEAATAASRSALQVHGAIGYTWEQDLQLWMRRAASLELDWGLPRLHRARVAERVLAEGARLGPCTTFDPDVSSDVRRSETR